MTKIWEHDIEMLECISRGMINEEISIYIDRPFPTVKSRLQNLYKKLDIGNEIKGTNRRLEAIRRAKQLGLIK